jgi:DNA-binding NtrC family response regulator
MSSHAIQWGKPRILCIDDSESQLWLRTQVLEKDGYSVLSATTAAKAVHLLRENTVHLILSDHLLSGTTGTQLAAELKKLKPRVPVVLYSGAPPSTMGDVDCFILKGQPISEFLTIIRDLVKRFAE